MITPKVIATVSAVFPSNIGKTRSSVVMAGAAMFGTLLPELRDPGILHLEKISHRVLSLKLLPDENVELEFEIYGTATGLTLDRYIRDSKKLKLHLIFGENNLLITCHFTPYVMETT